MHFPRILVLYKYRKRTEKAQQINGKGAIKMKRDQFNIFQSEDGTIFAYTDSLGEATEYIDQVIKAGHGYSVTVKGIATIYTIITH